MHHLKNRLGKLLTLYQIGLLVYIILRRLFRDSTRWLALINTFSLYLFVPLIITLPLAIVARLRTNIIIGLLLTGVGMVRFFRPQSPPEATDTSATQQGQRLKIVTFNAWGGNKNMCTSVDWLIQSQADVIILQEIEPPGYDARLADLYAQYPYEAIGDSHIRIFSKIPLVEQKLVKIGELPYERYALRVVLETGVVIYGVHPCVPRDDFLQLPKMLNFFPINFILRYDETHRNRQIRCLLEHIRHETAPIIVAGDFNTSDNSTIYQELAEELHDSYREVGTGFGHTWSVPGAGYKMPPFMPLLLRIDYIWHSHHFRAVESYRGIPLGSDHLPVVAVLECKEPTQIEY